MHRTLTAVAGTALLTAALSSLSLARPATDEHTRVLGAEGRPIPGLFAVGNDAASVMGGNYPGAGITLGPNMTFGWLTGQHIAAVAKHAPAEQRHAA